ncbi:MAG: hypothetical protein MZV70_48770 [Desulfobacterales bacterium]|nr:hypothetical protein [Desulfobacterales bacterium]
MNIADRFSKPPQLRRILIVQLGDIGDVVWSLPAFRPCVMPIPTRRSPFCSVQGNGSLLYGGRLACRRFSRSKKELAESTPSDPGAPPGAV